MPVNAVAENVFGTIGTICWTIQLVPQIWKSWRTKSTEGLSPTFIFMWSFGSVFMGIYAVVQDLNVPLMLQPQLFGTLSLLSWIQCQYYGAKRPLWLCVVLFIVLFLIFGGLEAGIVFAIRPSARKGHQAPVTAMGIISSAIISLALVPQYWEIYKHQEVIGISILFMTVDLLGGIFSDLSLVFKPHFDIVASVTYSLVVVLDGVVIVCALILNPIAAKRRRRAALELAPHIAETPSTINDQGPTSQMVEVSRQTSNTMPCSQEEGAGKQKEI